MGDTDMNRRDLLKRGAITGAIALGAGTAATGSASARSVGGTRRVSADVAERLLEANEGGLLSALSEEGLLETGDVSTLPTEADVDVSSLKSRSGTAYLERQDKPDQLVVSVRDGLADNVDSLRLAVVPDTGRAGAFFETEAGDYQFAEFQDGGVVTSDVEAQASCGCDCWYDCYGDCDLYPKKDYVCCYSGGLCDYTCGGC